MEFIARNLSNPIGSPQIADALGIKRPTLDTLFRDATGASPRAWRSRIRT